MPGSKDRNDGPGDEYRITDLETGEVLPLAVEILHGTSIRLESCDQRWKENASFLTKYLGTTSYNVS